MLEHILRNALLFSIRHHMYEKKIRGFTLVNWTISYQCLTESNRYDIVESRLIKKRLFNVCNDIDEVTSIYVIIGGTWVHFYKGL